MWKWLVGIFIVLALSCGGAGFFLFGTAQGKKLVEQVRPKPPLTEVRLEAAARGSLVRVVSAPGLIEPEKVVKVRARVSSRVIALPFREGDVVHEGDVVVRLDADDQLAALEATKAGLKGEEARLEGAKAALAEATAEVGRIRELYDSKDVSKADLDAAEAAYQRALSNLKASEFSIEIAKANILRAQKDLDNTTITAAIDGTITKLYTEVGEQVLGTSQNEGSLIMEIADLSVMLLKAKIDESNIAPVQPGQEATVYVNAYPDDELKGTVRRVELQRTLDRDNTSYFETEVLVEIPQGLKRLAGLNANADVHVERFDGVLKVPSQAVLDRRVDELPRSLADNPLVDRSKAFARVVYRLIDGKAAATPVTVGSSDQSHTVILAGLEEGDKVVTGPYKVLVGLKHDQRVVEEGTQAKPGDEKKSEVAATGEGAHGGS